MARTQLKKLLDHCDTMQKLLKTNPIDQDYAHIECDGEVWNVEQVIEALTPLILEPRVERMRSVLETRLTTVALALEDLHLGHNGAACLRTAEGLGVHDIVAAELSGPYPTEDDSEFVAACPSYVPRKVTKAAHQWIDLTTTSTSAGLFDWAQARGMKIYGAGPRGTMTLDDVPVDEPIAILFGNEKRGLREDTMDRCDQVFRIPMYGFTESFNVSVSVGMALTNICARKRAWLAERGLKGDMPAERQKFLLAKWMISDQRAPGQLLRRLIKA